MNQCLLSGCADFNVPILYVPYQAKICDQRLVDAYILHYFFGIFVDCNAFLNEIAIVSYSISFPVADQKC